MPKYENKYEINYYTEKKQHVTEVTDAKEQERIEQYMVKHQQIPPKNTARESGYSAYVLSHGAKINPSLIHGSNIKKKHGFFVSRRNNAPKLPVSCLASTEHVVAMQNGVTDFVSEDLPAAKKQVMYQIRVHSAAKKLNVPTIKKHLLQLLKSYDNLLDEHNVAINYEGRRIFIIQVSTQIADIQLLVRALRSKKEYEIVDCSFEDISLNEGVLLIKKDASNPIHAMVNVVDHPLEKGFLERDAGTTSGMSTGTYQDNKWTFNFFKGLKEMREQSDFPQDALAIKIIHANNP